MLDVLEGNDFPKIQKDEQSEILNAIQNFGGNILKRSEEWAYISSFLQKDGTTSLKICSYSSGLGIEDDIYLKFGKYHIGDQSQKQIVVARISFKKRKSGYGTALLKTLCEIGERYNYVSLHIEEPNPDCKAFMKKIGFKEDEFLPILKLKESIEEYESRKRV